MYFTYITAYMGKCIKHTRYKTCHVAVNLGYSIRTSKSEQMIVTPIYGPFPNFCQTCGNTQVLQTPFCKVWCRRMKVCHLTNDLVTECAQVSTAMCQNVVEGLPIRVKVIITASGAQHYVTSHGFGMGRSTSTCSW